MKSQPELLSELGFLARAAGTLLLALCLAAGVRAQDQAQQGQSKDPVQQAQGQTQDQAEQPSAQESQSSSKYPPQDADKPPYAKDRRARDARNGQSGQELPPTALHSQLENPPQAPTQLPSVLTIPAGTILLIRTNDFLSSDRNQIGDQFTAVLEQPIVVNGWVVARRGQVLIGQVKAAQKAGRVRGGSQLGLELTDLTVVDGRQVPILTELWKGSAGTSHGQDAATIAGTTGFGALIGAAADWGRGAAIGAGAGAAVGIGAVLLTRGRPTEVFAETPLSFRLVDPVKVDTTASQQAFLPVTQGDFDGNRGEHHRPRLAAGYPSPWYGPCGYYRPCYLYRGAAYIY